MQRSDISPFLIHFTKPLDQEEAFQKLQKIISDEKLIGCGNWIKGLHPCICFTEAPVGSIGGKLCNQFGELRYSSFGIRVTKRWLMDQGGRPVIYQPDCEYSMLPESHRWRHVRYEVGNVPKEIDFTWEREWRIQCDKLPFDPQVAQIVVPSEEWKERLLHTHLGRQESLVMDYGQICGHVLAEHYRSPFPWQIIVTTQ